MVLEVGWAYGPGGVALKGKKLLQVITTGSPSMSYQPEGHHKHSIHTFLSPFRQTAQLCHMEYLPPFVVHGTHRLTDMEVRESGQLYAKLFDELLHGTASHVEYDENLHMNEWLRQLQAS